jgi:hypothetical protein
MILHKNVCIGFALSEEHYSKVRGRYGVRSLHTQMVFATKGENEDKEWLNYDISISAIMHSQ